MKSKKENIVQIIGTVLLTFMIFWAHRSVPFMMDDIWYGTNLATNEPLQNFMDIIEGQVWHFHNWGGRCITHGVLQLTLMSGELCADILNTLMTLLLAWMICVVAKRKSAGTFLMALTLLLALNANMRMSMFWQAGVVNYVYSTVWILLFVWPYLCEWREDTTSQFPLITLWMIPIGLMTGWSNENMGPTSLLLAVATMIYCKKWKRTAVKPWMIVGTVGALLGSILVVAAPGNFVRSATIEKKGLLETVWERFYSMLCAGTDFLFPICLLLALIILIKCVCLKQALEKYQIVLLVFMILSFGAMVLSPHYPDRATFGTMVMGIILLLTVLYDGKLTPLFEKYYVHVLTGCFLVYAVISLIGEFAVI